MSDEKPKPTDGDSTSKSTESSSSSSSNSKESASTSSDMIKIIVKTSKGRESFDIANDAGVKVLREMVSERYKIDISSVCLIFSGRIMKDADTLKDHKMKDGYIVHLVIREKGKPTSYSATPGNTNTTTASSSTTTTAASNTNTGQGTNENTNTNPSASPFNFPFGNLNETMGNLVDPELMNRVLESPMFQNMLSNPEIFRLLISNTPQFQELVERNPEFNHVLSNREILRQTIEMIRNPVMLQELMRSHDRALSNLESSPGGYNALRRLYTEVQEPILNAAQEQYGINPFASNNNSSENTGSTTPSNTENREPLPNPWQRTENTASGGGGGGGGTGNGGQNRSSPFANLFGPNNPFMQQMMGGMSEPILQQMMREMSDNPDMVAAMMNNPMVQNMMQSLTSNPQLMSQILQQPLSAMAGTGGPNNNNNNNSTGTTNVTQSTFNSLTRNVTNPLVQRINNDVQAMQAFIQVQQGYEQLRQRLNVPFSDLHVLIQESSQNFTNSPTNTTSTTTTASAANPVTQPTPAAATATNNPGLGTGGVNQNFNIDLAARMVQQMLQVGNQQSPEQRYQTQLSQMEAMGFTNREANLQALIETFGNVEAAIDRILSRM